MAIVDQQCSTLDTSEGSGKSKYVPPHKRMMAAATTPPFVRQDSSQQAPSRAHSMRSAGLPSYTGDASGGGYRNNSGMSGRGPGYPRHEGGNSGVNSGSSFHRWDNLSDRGTSAKSTTGTGWDVRDNRRWYREDEREVFKSDVPKSETGVNFDSYESIPVEVSGIESEKIAPLSSFQATVGVHPIVQENIKRVNYLKPTPVQKYAIPSVFSGRDVMACAQTGSGKTAAFLFPVISRMLSDGPPATPPDTGRMKNPTYPVALILSPTRELAIQTFVESRKFSFNSGVRTVVLYGGASTGLQLRDLDRGCDVCVATPGRLEDIMERGKITLSVIKFLVLDEADRMLDMGFEPKIRDIVLHSDMPSSDQGRQTVMFSATFPREIQELASSFLLNYIFITVGRVGSTNDFIVQDIIYVEEDYKTKKLVQILQECSEGLTLVFVETKRKAEMVECYLHQKQFSVTSIHGDRDQKDREFALKHFRSGRCPILVATDVAARGLDIPNIKRVINLDLPSNIDDYVHRIGRTGRAGNQGKATSFINESNSGVLRDLHGLLEESSQDTPSWFTDMMRHCTAARKHFNRGSSGGGYGGRGRGRGAFGGRDIRNDDRQSNNARQSDSSPGHWRNERSAAESFSRTTPRAVAGGTRQLDGDDGW